MKPSKSNDFAIHIFHGHIYSFICMLILFCISLSVNFIDENEDKEYIHQLTFLN